MNRTEQQNSGEQLTYIWGTPENSLPQLGEYLGKTATVWGYRVTCLGPRIVVEF